jgi:hypothetical protein
MEEFLTTVYYLITGRPGIVSPPWIKISIGTARINQEKGKIYPWP